MQIPRKAGVPFVTLIGALVAGASPATAIEPPPPGRLLAAQCSQCHGTDGIAVRFKSIAGKDNLYTELRHMKFSGGHDIMDLQARGYTDEQLRLLGEYYATLPQRSGD